MKQNLLAGSARFRFVACASLLALAACSSSSPGSTSGAGGSGTGSGGSASGGSGPGSGGSFGMTGSGGAIGSGGATVTDAAADGPVTALNPVATHGQLKVVGTQLQDQAGKPVQLKGVSSQWLNYESKTFPESKPALQYARDHWKLSVIRAAMGVDAQGGYLSPGTGAAAAQATMLSKVNTIVQNAIDLGLYVIVDWHTSNAVTAKGTTTQATDASAFFTQIATQYGASPNVIYEPFNEPTTATWAQIKPYHEAVVAAIRAVDSDNLIVLGTPTWSQDVDLAAADPLTGTNLLYTLHFYACTHKQSLRDKANKAISMGLPLFVTEFGATPSDGGVMRSGDNDVCEARDQHLVRLDGAEQHQRRVLEARSVHRLELHPHLRRAGRRPLDRQLPHQRQRRHADRRRREGRRPRPLRRQLDAAVGRSLSGT